MGTERIGLIGRVALHARRTAVTKLRGWNARDLGVGGEVGAAGIARRSTFAKDAEAHRAHEADAHRTLVAETRGSKVDAARGGELEVRATAHVQGGGGEEVLKQTGAMRGLDVGAASDVRGLLEKRRIVLAERERVYGY